MRDKIAEIFNDLDDHMLDGDFDYVKEYIKNTDIKLDTTLLISILSITLCACEKLNPERSDFYNKVEKEFIKRCGEDYTKELLKGLERYKI